MRTCRRQYQCVHPEGPELPESEFYQYPNGRYYSYCIECERARSWYRKHPEVAIADLEAELPEDSLLRWWPTKQVNGSNLLKPLDEMTEADRQYCLERLDKQ